MRATITYFIACVFGILSTHAIAQSNFVKVNPWQVIQFGDTLTSAWAGGLNSPQFSSIDLDLDGTLDLVVFDRSTDNLYTFINGGTANEIDYHYDPSYEEHFPELINWALMVDYDCDGREDIFASRPPGIEIYRNISTQAEGLKFDYVVELLEYDDDDFTTPIILNARDLPSISDIDDDDDIDILIQNSFGTATLYQNMSQENNGNCDALAYELTDECWGKFQEDDTSNAIFLGITCKGNSQRKDGPEHFGGATFLALDLDGDNDRELIIGDFTTNNLTQLTNGGSTTAATMTSIDADYPSTNTSVDLTVFPAAYFVDVNNDNAKDFLVAPNNTTVSEDHRSVWYYENTGTTSSPIFQFIDSSFIQEEMLEWGRNSHPAFFDYNNDTLADLVISNSGRYSQALPSSRLALYENTGTVSAPRFELVDPDFGNLAGLNLLEFHPTFGDLDDDGDDDLILGQENGSLMYLENTAPIGSDAQFDGSQAISNYMNISTNSFSTPHLVDLNEDGLLDLLVGKFQGTLSYYENTGTAASPQFDGSNPVDNFGGVDVTEFGFSTGYSVPHVTQIDNSDSTYLMVGAENGHIQLFGPLPSNLSDTFPLISTKMSNLDLGLHAAPVTMDLDGDGKNELICGNNGGGLAYFEGTDSTIISTPEKSLPSTFETMAFPNPGNGRYTLQFSAPLPGEPVLVTMFDLTGKLQHQQSVLPNENQLSLNIQDLVGGMYFGRVQLKDGTTSFFTLIQQ